MSPIDFVDKIHLGSVEERPFYYLLEDYHDIDFGTFKKGSIVYGHCGGGVPSIIFNLERCLLLFSDNEVDHEYGLEDCYTGMWSYNDAYHEIRAFQKVCYDPFSMPIETFMIEIFIYHLHKNRPELLDFGFEYSFEYDDGEKVLSLEKDLLK